MSSFIVTPYRMRRPSTQTQLTSRNRRDIATPSPQDAPKPEVHTDDLKTLQDMVSSIKRDIETTKATMNPISKRLSSVERQSRQNVSGIKSVNGKLAPTDSINKRIQEIEDTTKQTSVNIKSLQSEIVTDISASNKRLQHVEDITSHISTDFETLKKEIIPEIGTNKRVNVMEAKLTFTINNFADEIDKLKRSQEEMNNRLVTINDTIAEHSIIKVLVNRMDEIESRIDRLMSTLSGLSQVPVIQRRVTGTGTGTESADTSVQFGTIHKVTSH